MDATEFWSICSANGMALSREQMAQFERYAGDLIYWNEKVNLISRRDIEHVWLHHILHSVSIAFTGELPKSGKVLDIGTGGGLPGIPLKILNPKFDITLLDSIAKKVQTVGMMAGHITVHGLRAIRQRAEELPNDPKLKGPYDLIVSRATAPLVDLMKWSRPVLKNTGKILTLKGGALTEEIRQAQTKFPDAEITVIDLRVRGADWFELEEKRLVRVRWETPFAAPAEETATIDAPAENDDEPAASDLQG
ncbi:MAG: 16S rRNA (guanine(527)-N(7))-methyltransferase RsmG [Candidatus Kapaibacterium sp.]